MNTILTNVKQGRLNSTVEMIINKASAYDFSSDPVFTVNIFPPVKVAHTELNNAINRLKSKSFQKENDSLVDDAWTSLVLVSRGLLTCHIPEVVTNVRVISPIIEKNGLDVTRLAYSEQASAISAAIADFEKPEVATAIAAVPIMASIIEKVKEYNEAFLAGMMDFADNIEGQTEKENASDIKWTLLELVNKKLIPYLDIMSEVNPELYEGYYTAVKGIVRQANTSIRIERGLEEDENEREDKE